MSIIAQSLKYPKIKPRWIASLGFMEQVVAYNCKLNNLPIPSLCMPFWEGAGNKVHDVSGTRNHGTIGGAVWTSGKSGNALRFDGTNDYVDVPHSGSLDVTTGELTLLQNLCLTKNTPTNGWTDFITKVLSDNWNTGYWTEVYDFSGTEYLGFGFGTGQEVRTTTAISLNRWYQFVVTYNDNTNTISLYLNGNPDDLTVVNGEPETSSIINNEYSVHINGITTGEFLGGLTDNVMIFNRALTAAQVKFLYDYPYALYQMPQELWGYVAAAGGFQPAWARNSNQIIQGIYI